MGVIDDFKTPGGSVKFLITGLLLMVISGLVLAGIWFFLDTTEAALLNTDCVIQGNVFFSDCQGLWEMAVYPFLVLKDVVVYLSMFFIAILLLGMLISGYNSGSRPYMLGILLLVEIGITYSSIWIANIYRQLLANEVILNAMISFSVYNKIMLNFPWFVFVVSIFSLGLGIVNWQRVKINKTEDATNY